MIVVDGGSSISHANKWNGLQLVVLMRASDTDDA